MAQSEFNLQDFWKQFSDRLKAEAGKRKRKASPDPAARGFDLGTDEAEGFTPRSTSSSALIKFLRFCLFFVAGALITLNVKPYVGISAWIGTGLGSLVST